MNEYRSIPRNIRMHQICIAVYVRTGQGKSCTVSNIANILHLRVSQHLREIVWDAVEQGLLRASEHQYYGGKVSKRFTYTTDPDNFSLSQSQRIVSQLLKGGKS